MCSIYFIGCSSKKILNIILLLKQGKLKQLTKVLKEYKILICVLQETRSTDEDLIDHEGSRIKGSKAGAPVDEAFPYWNRLHSVVQ